MTPTEPQSSDAALKTSRRFWLITLGGWFVMLAAVIGGLFAMRSRAIAMLDTPQAQAAWKAWRDDVAKQTKEGSKPVARRVPKSLEPPELVLLRDYLASITIGAGVLTTALYGFLAWITHGMWLGRKPASRT